jgi:peptide/nickel transport system substrate-binding protein
LQYKYFRSKEMNKYWPVLIVTLVLSFLLVSCSNAPSNSPSAAPPATTAKASTAPAVSNPPAASPTVSISPSAVQTKPAASAATTPKRGGTLRIIYDNTPSIIGWPVDITGDSSTSPQLVFEPLLRGDAAGNLYPWLAESYKVADDLLSITFSLRKGVKFHDGSDFNAQAAKWNLDNVVASKKQPTWKSVDIVDDYTVRVNLNSWQNNIPNMFADNNYSYMASPAAFQKNGIDWMRQNPVGTGAFKFVSFARDVSFKVTKNPDYWQKGLPYLDAVEVLYVADTSTRVMSMKAGNGDVMVLNPDKTAFELQTAGFPIVVKMEGTWVLMGDSVNADSPWANQKVREAVEYSLNREDMAKALGYGFAKAAYQIPPRSNAAYVPDFALARKYDPAKAKQLLSEAGYTSGFKTTIVGSPVGLNKDVCGAVQSFLQQVGIQADLQYPDMGTWTANYLPGPPKNTIVFTNFPGSANYNQFFSSFVAGSPNYKNWAKSPEFTKMMTDSLTSPKYDVNLIKAATNQITKEASMVPVFEAGRSYAVNSYVMDGGWMERSLAPYWKLEQAWLNK